LPAPPVAVAFDRFASRNLYTAVGLLSLDHFSASWIRAARTPRPQAAGGNLNGLENRNV
jgi:hypothetical protein